MPQERFFIDLPLSQNQEVVLCDSEQSHLRVMRPALGDTVELVNGKGTLATAKLVKMLKETSHLHILSTTIQKAPPTHIALAIPLMRASKLEWIIEKATEIGADSFLIYPADQSELETLSPNKIERLRLLTIAALKQSGRLFLPSLEIGPLLPEILARETSTLYGDPLAEAPLTSTSSSLIFLTGPEKGFSEKERKLLKEKAEGRRLSPYVLRAETAPLVAISVLSMR